MDHRRVLRAAIPALVLVVLLCAASPQPQSPSPLPASDVRSQLERAHTMLAAHAHDTRVRGVATSELIARIDDDLSQLGASSTQSSGPDQASMELAARLDVSLVDQLLSSASPAPPGLGANEVLVPSTTAGSVQPLALYLPPSYDRARSAPLIIMLPNQGQSETQLIATPYLRALADENQAVLAVPAFAANRSFTSADGDAVYNVLDTLQALLHLDRRRVYLAGYSMGAFGIFMIAPQRPQTWAALLSIAGTLTNEDKSSVVSAMAGKQVFMVAGSDDTQVDASYVRAAVTYLSANGVEARYEEQLHGTHALESLRPAVERAWRAMLSGVRNVAPESGFPSPEPTRTIHM
ncbi:MAG: hypothetical protein JO343_02475 [Candidatus Eremiobacteraeota bacterium]|nr:hypothetical protein [Candidatus Eremiobacteraeota bacterium]